MPRIEDHINLADRNQVALTCLIDSDEDCSEWIATVAFYKGVQLIEAMLVKQKGRGSQEHSGRLRKLRAEFPAIYKQFRPLYQSSMVARYLCDRPDNGVPNSYRCFTDYMEGDVIDRLVKRKLRPLEDALMPLLSPQVFQRADV